MASRDLKLLYPPFRNVIKKGLKIAESRNLPITITCTRRLQIEQEALYAQGRELLDSVNTKRKFAGLPPIKESTNKKKITWTKSSYHTTFPLSMAVDYAIGKRKIEWDIKVDVNDNEIADYQEFANICKSIDPKNIEYGGDWKKKDSCHLQWRNGKNINQETETIKHPQTQNPLLLPKEKNKINKPKNVINKDKPTINHTITTHTSINKSMPILEFISKILSVFKKWGRK